MTLISFAVSLVVLVVWSLVCTILGAYYGYCLGTEDTERRWANAVARADADRNR